VNAPFGIHRVESSLNFAETMARNLQNSRKERWLRIARNGHRRIRR
jgi:hypothetical protein